MSEPIKITLIVLTVLIPTVIIPAIYCHLFLPKQIFKMILTRSRPDKWSRDHCSDLKNEEMVAMWNQSLAFEKENENVREDIHVVTEDGLKLAGQYFDFGSDMAVIIAPGRPETCVYSCYYGYSYKRAGVNVLAIDTRAHGESEGTIHGCGYMEQYDILAFAKYLHEVKGVNKILLHGICVGSCSCSFVVAREDCPDYIVGIMTDGLYISFYETLWRRTTKNGGLPWVVCWYSRRKIKKLYGTDIKTEGPIVNVTKIKVPMVMVASKEDIFSLPKKTQMLFDINSSPDKKMVWWDKGAHSHLRYVDEEKYDHVVDEFVSKFRA